MSPLHGFQMARHGLMLIKKCLCFMAHGKHDMTYSFKVLCEGCGGSTFKYEQRYIIGRVLIIKAIAKAIFPPVGIPS